MYLKKKQNKYHNKKVVNAYGKFDSTKEFEFFLLLLNRCKRGEITDLKRQVKFVLIPTQYEEKTIQLKTKTKKIKRVIERKCSYYADYVYTENGKTVVVDTKGGKATKTQEYKIKRKLMLLVHGIRIKEM